MAPVNVEVVTRLQSLPALNGKTSLGNVNYGPGRGIADTPTICKPAGWKYPAGKLIDSWLPLHQPITLDLLGFLCIECLAERAMLWLRDVCRRVDRVTVDTQCLSTLCRWLLRCAHRDPSGCGAVDTRKPQKIKENFLIFNLLHSGNPELLTIRTRSLLP